jgi:hypothetical protein
VKDVAPVRFDVDGREVAVPDLATVPGVDAVTAAQEQRLEVVLHDTADGRLRAAGIVLQHRAGGADEGWHLELPLGRHRDVITADGAAAEVPRSLAALVRSRTRSADLAPVATVSTRRLVQVLQDGAGRPLAEVADDTATGRRPDGTADDGRLVWREWAVRSLDGDDALLDAVGRRLLSAGARPATAGAALGRLLPRPSQDGGGAVVGSRQEGRTSDRRRGRPGTPRRAGRRARRPRPAHPARPAGRPAQDARRHAPPAQCAWRPSARCSTAVAPTRCATSCAGWPASSGRPGTPRSCTPGSGAWSPPSRATSCSARCRSASTP